MIMVWYFSQTKIQMLSLSGRGFPAQTFIWLYPLIHTARSIDKCFARLREWYLKVLLLQVETDAHVKRQEQTLYGYIPYSGYDLFPSIGLYFSEKRLTSIKIIKRYICSSMIDKEAAYACLRFKDLALPRPHLAKIAS